jgi:hypothetical protein
MPEIRYNTVSNGNTNITSEQDGNCQGNSTSTNDDYIQGLASDWTWYIQLVIYSIGLPIVIIAGPLSDGIGRKTLVVYNLVLSSISFSAFLNKSKQIEFVKYSSFLLQLHPKKRINLFSNECLNSVSHQFSARVVDLNHGLVPSFPTY